jgi:hypothetical protein
MGKEIQNVSEVHLTNDEKIKNKRMRRKGNGEFKVFSKRIIDTLLSSVITHIETLSFFLPLWVTFS